MRFLSLFIPVTVERRTSAYHRDLRVFTYKGEYTLVANGTRQSGPEYRTLWNQVFKAFSPASRSIKSIAVLGVAGGTVFSLLASLFPKASIVGVDIDEVIVELGKKYFGIAAIPRLTIHIGDAMKFIKDQREKKKTYDLIICDLYVGNDNPAFLSDAEFLKSLKESLNPKGAILVNMLKEGQVKEGENSFFARAKNVFPVIKTKDIDYSRFYLLER